MSSLPFVPLFHGFVPRTPPVGNGASGGGGGGTNPTFLSLSFTDSADPVLAASNFTYTAQVANLGPNVGVNVDVVLTIDPALAIVSVSAPGWINGGIVANVITLSQAAMAVGPATPIVVTVTAPNATALLSSTAKAFATNAGLVIATQATQSVLINRDGPESVMLPLTLPEFEVWPLGVPSFALMASQPSPGPFVDVVQQSPPSLVASGAGISFQQARASWVATFFGTTDGTDSAGAGGDLTTWWNFDTQNVTILTYVQMVTVASRRTVLQLDKDQQRVDILNSGQLSLTRNNKTGTFNYKTTVVFPLLIDWQPPADNLGHGPGLFNVATNKEQIIGTANQPTGSGSVGFAAAGLTGSFSPGGFFGPMYVWAAKKATQQQLVTQHARIASLGWAMAW